MRTMKAVAKAAREMTREQFLDALEAAGFKQLGQGAFSTTYGRKRSKFVVKVGGHDYAVNDDGYVPYAEWLATGQRCGNPDALLPAFPRVYDVIRRYRDDSDEPEAFAWHVTILERLNGLVKGDPFSSKKARTISSALKARTNQESEEWMSEAQRKLLASVPVSTLRACDLIRERFAERWQIDMHCGNFLRRGRSQIVFSDPLSFPV